MPACADRGCPWRWPYWPAGFAAAAQSVACLVNAIHHNYDIDSAPAELPDYSQADVADEVINELTDER